MIFCGICTNRENRHSASISIICQCFVGRGNQGRSTQRRGTVGSVVRRRSSRGMPARRPQIHELREAPVVEVLGNISGEDPVRPIVTEATARSSMYERTQRRSDWTQTIHSVAEVGRPIDVANFQMPGFKLIDDRFAQNTTYSRNVAASMQQSSELTTLPNNLRPTKCILPDLPTMSTDVMRLAYSRSMIHVRRWPVFRDDDLIRAIQNMPVQFQPSVIVCIIIKI